MNYLAFRGHYTITHLLVLDQVAGLCVLGDPEVGAQLLDHGDDHLASGGGGEFVEDAEALGAAAVGRDLGGQRGPLGVHPGFRGLLLLLDVCSSPGYPALHSLLFSPFFITFLSIGFHFVDVNMKTFVAGAPCCCCLCDCDWSHSCCKYGIPNVYVYVALPAPFCLHLRFDYTAIKALISAIRLNNLFSSQKKRRNSQHSEKRAREMARCKQLFVGLVAGGQ